MYEVLHRIKDLYPTYEVTLNGEPDHYTVKVIGSDFVIYCSRNFALRCHTFTLVVKQSSRKTGFRRNDLNKTRMMFFAQSHSPLEEYHPND